MRKLAYIIFAFLLLGCSDAILPEGQPELVIEGWIEAGGPPVVLVSTTVPVTSNWREMEPVLESCVVRWATVSIHDGEQEIFLTGKLNTDYLPPFIYTTSRIEGEVGKKYKLKVSYGGRTAEAETIIPEPKSLAYIEADKISEDSYEITAGLADDPETKDYYKFFTMIKDKDAIYESSFMGLVDDADLSEDVSEVKVWGKFTSAFGSTENNTYFSPGDQVYVRFCTLSEESYNYWHDFEDVASLSLNPFFPVTKKIRSNVQGGLGYWAGYGSKYYSVTIPN